jgi:DNA repair exonuclease SbcCD nuclease subunit
VRTQFADLLAATRWRAGDAHARILCIHQCVEGATVGPNDFTFTTAADVIRARDLPAGLAAVLSGHIHRHQVLTRDLRGMAIAAPVLYPGSIERTSLAEANETKGYLTVDLTRGAGETRVDWRFHQLPARPLVRHEIHLDAVRDSTVEAAIRNLIAASPADAVLTIRVVGRLGEDARRTLAAANLRRLAPATMNIELKLEDEDGVVVRPASPRQSDVVLELPLG